MTSSTREKDIELLGQGSYGCVYKPSIQCDGKLGSKKYITKIQEKALDNEINIGKKVQKIPDFDKYFSPILEVCSLNLSKIGEDKMKYCMIYNKKTEYISSKIKYVGKNTLHKSLYNLLDKYPKLFFRMYISSHVDLLKYVDILYKHKIVHMDLKQDNIMIKDKSNTPIIIDFGLSFDMSDFKPEEVFFAYGYDYSPWAMDIIMITYMVYYKGNEDLKWYNDVLTQEDIEKVLSDTMKANTLMTTFTKEDRLQYEEKCYEYFKPFKGKICKELYAELLKNSYSWDSYALCSMYYKMLANYNLLSEPIFKGYSKLLKSYLLEVPNKRITTLELRKNIKSLFNMDTIKESKKIISKKLKSMQKKEKQAIEKKMQNDYINELNQTIQYREKQKDAIVNK